MRISCILPTYNREGLLTEALNSIRAQTRPPDEVLVIDNGTIPLNSSSDTFTNVRVIRIEAKAGASRARNAGVAASTGDTVAFLDDDDMWSSTYLANAEQALLKGADCVVSRLDALQGKTVTPYKNPAGLLTIHNLLTWNPGVTGSNIVLKKNLFLSIGGFDIRLPTGEDKSLLIEALLKNAQVQTLPDNQVLHRLHPGERLSDPRSLARGINAFTEKYKKLMRNTSYYFNKRKIYRARVDAGEWIAYCGLIVYAALYRGAQIIEKELEDLSDVIKS